MVFASAPFNLYNTNTDNKELKHMIQSYGILDYQNLQRVRILVDDISLCKSSWNRALRVELYLSSSRQQQAAKRGEMSQILHVM